MRSLSFFQLLERRAQQVNSLLCLGLDPHQSDLASFTPAAARDFCLRLVEACADLVAAVKPNAAFFEVLGPSGMQVLQEVMAALPAGVPVILDAKRGDIASSAQAYAQAAFETYGATAITVNPYLGKDALDPFLQDPQKGVFLLCKTSNPGAADLQDQPVGAGYARKPLYQVVAEQAQSWNTRDNLGLVVGATQLEALKRVRAAAPDLWFLSPGVGAQGGDLAAALKNGLRADGWGMLIPVSRGLSRSADARQEALRLNAAIQEARSDLSKLYAAALPKPAAPTLPAELADLADGLLDAGCVKFGRFTLKSGLESPVYLDLRQLVSHPLLLQQAARAYGNLLQGMAFDRLAALPYAALPIGTAVSLELGLPMIYPRKEVKTYGTKAEIEGVYQAGEIAAVIDDLTTTGSTKFEAIERLTGAGLVVKDIVVLIDRQSGAVEALAAAGYRLHAVFNLTQLLAYWEQAGRISAEQAAEVRQFIAQSRA